MWEPRTAGATGAGETGVQRESRRGFIAGAVGAAAAAGVLGHANPAAAQLASPGNPEWVIWALNFEGVVVPSDTWTVIPWPDVIINSSPAYLDPDGFTWIWPAGPSAGIWGMLLNLAWDNALSPTGEPISPPTHRKLVRIPQADTGTPQVNQAAITAASTEVVYHADLAALGDQLYLSDGTRGYQQQQVYIQAGMDPARTDQRVWLEVYQNSGQPLMVAFDGQWRTPQTATRPTIWAIQSPSLMIAYLCDFQFVS